MNHSRRSREDDVLAAVRENPGCTKAAIITIADVHPATADRRLAALIRGGVVRRERETRAPDQKSRARWLYTAVDGVDAPTAGA